MLNKTQSQIMEYWNSSNIPLVTVVCLTYNHEKFIKKAIEGFLIQETTFPFEVIIHDDASTDMTTKIVKEYEERYPAIIKPIYQVENQFSKKIYSMKYISPHIKGKYVAICEGDDHWCSSEKLQKQFEYMENNPECEMCTHNTIFHFIDGSKPDRYFHNWINTHELSLEDIFFGWNVHTSSYFMKKENYINRPAFASKYWFGDYTMLTISKYYGKVVSLPEVMSVYNAGIVTGVTMKNLNSDKDYKYKRSLERAEYLKEYNEFTNQKFDDIVNARIAEIDFFNNRNMKQLIDAAKAMQGTEYYKHLISKDKFTFNGLKIRWKFGGYIFGIIWYASIMLRRHYKRKNIV